MTNEQQYQFAHAPEQKARTVLINDHGVSATKFDIPSKTIEDLYQSGYQCTKKWLADWKPPVD